VFTTVILNPEVFSNTVNAIPPGEPTTFLNTTVSLVDLPCPGSFTVTTAEPLVKLKGSPGSKLGVTGSVLSVLVFSNAIPSALCGLGSNCGCFGSYSETWTNEPTCCATKHSIVFRLTSFC